jgi:chemotaxis response regulator CheB
MPQSAIDSGCIDYILSPEAIADAIVRIARGAGGAESGDAGAGQNHA